MTQLYKPVLEKALKMPFVGVQVTGRLRRDMPRSIVVVGTLEEAVRLASNGTPTVFHWLENTPALRAVA